MSSKKLERKRAMEELTRKDILESAIEIIQESGEKQLTMDRVAAGAGIAKGTVYLYYKNKQELLDSVVEFSFAPLEREWAEIVGNAGDPVWKLEECLRASLELVEKNKPLLKGLKDVMFNTRGQFISDPDSWYWTSVKLFTAALDEGVEAGKLRPMNSVKIASLFLDSINCLASQRILTAVQESIEEDVREVMDLYIRGLAK